MFGPCKVCLAHEAHIKSLKEEVANLKALLQPAPANSSWGNVNIQADAMLSGSELPNALSEEEQKQRDLINSEAMRLLTATY